MNNWRAFLPALATVGVLAMAPAAFAQEVEEPVDCSGAAPVGECAPDEVIIVTPTPPTFDNTGEAAEPTTEEPTEPEPEPTGDPGASPNASESEPDPV